MKKFLLSLAVIAASGAYIAENRDGVSLPAIGPASAGLAAPASKPGIAPASLTIGPQSLAPVAPVARVAAAVPASKPAPAPMPVASAAAAPPAPTAPPVVPAPSGAINVAQIIEAQQAAPANTLTVAAPVEPLPPIPLPRPADAPTAAAVVVPAATKVAQAQGRYRDGSFKGTSENAYYGRVQVKVVVKGGQITAVDVLQYPNDRRTSRYINSQALPMLEQEVIQAQSGNIDTISGATLTSGAYLQSLASALAAAGGGNNA